MKLETKRLILEPLKREHAEKLFNGYCDESIYQYLELDVPESLEWLQDEFSIVEKGEHTNSKGKHMLFYYWAVYSKVDRTYIGRSEFTIYDNGDCNVAYVFFSPFWKQGYAYEATVESLKFVKSTKKVKKFIITCDTWNVGSRRIAEKLGFKFIETAYGVNNLKDRVGDDFVFEQEM
jgi:RimJ/RimL family protein N-acetyltransferase